jgi:hypothetical protein
MTISALTAALFISAQVGTPIGGGTLQGELGTALADNSNCMNCHADPDDVAMAGNAYNGSLMHLAGVDPIFLTSLEIAYDDVQVSAELCIRCHYPRGWLAGRGEGTPEQFFGLNDDDKQGIQCDYCHRMESPDPQDPNGVNDILVANAQVFLSDNTAKKGPLNSGNTLGHTTEYSALMEDSIICGQCHDVSNTFVERIDDNGDSLQQPVPIERTYSEWKASDFGDPTSPDYATCQSCHMKSYTGVSASIGDPPERTLHEHKIVGGNEVVPRMVSWLYADDQTAPDFIRIPSADAERIAAAAAQQVSEAGTLEALELIDTPTGPALRVKLENETGHKLPTGYAEGRRIWISHATRLPDGRTGTTSGNIDPATWEFVAGEEPLRTYEILLSEGLDPNHSFHFVRVDRLIKDNRIPPKGFVPATDTEVVAHDYPANADGTLQHWDEITLPLGVAWDDACWPVIVDVKALFQSSSGDYFRFLVANSPTFGPDLEAAWNAVGGALPSVVDEINVAVFPDGTIEPAGFHLCEQGYAPVVEEPDAGPAPDVDAGEEPDPDDTPPDDTPPDVEQDPLCACTQASTTPPMAGLLLLFSFLLPLARLRARKAS